MSADKTAASGDPGMILRGWLQVHVLQSCVGAELGRPWQVSCGTR